MKILLINPPLTVFPGTREPQGGFPLGIMYIAAVLDQAGYEVEILDALIADFPPQYEGDTHLVGMPWEEIGVQIRQRKPDIVGISNLGSAQIDDAFRVAEIVKGVDSKILTVVGGPHVTVRPLESLKASESVDVVAIGEGEYIMLELVECFAGHKDFSEVPGIAYRKDGEVRLNRQGQFIKNLDDLPFPAYHLVNIEDYLSPKRIRGLGRSFLRGMDMITSRGCPFNCAFCSVHLHMGRNWRAHSTDYVLTHIKHVIKQYQVEHILFNDDSMAVNIKRFEDIVDGMLTTGIKVRWEIPNGIRTEGLTLDLLRKMKRAGITKLGIGIESGEQDILDNVIDKSLRLERVVEVAKMCKEVGIKTSGNYVIGIPGERKENMQKTLDFALELKKKYDMGMFLSIATPYYGTRMYQICESKGYLTEPLTPRIFAGLAQAWGRGVIKTEDFTPEEVTELALKATSIYDRLAFFRSFRNPFQLTRWRLWLAYPGETLRTLKSILRR